MSEKNVTDLRVFPYPDRERAAITVCRVQDPYGPGTGKATFDGARLTRATLEGADLRVADLRGAVGIVTGGPVGRHARTIYAVDYGDEILVQAGCRWASAEDVIAAILEDYADSPLRDPYVEAVRGMVAYLEAVRETGGG